MNCGHCSNLQLSSASAQETLELGVALGRLLEAGDVLLLQGELGAGKTCLTQGIARGLGSTDRVLSPTFVLRGEYAGRVRLYHADLYRLESPDEVAELDLAGSTEDGVLVVEWPERDAGSLPADHLLVRIDHVNESRRSLTFEAHGDRSTALLRQVTADASVKARKSE
ncbi:MAG: tRNA (adenosine(37)-N6)-threonylcarbamoyltransferase complex ATPase subunit type 1 TsaE [Dehalococcoidia bacterium]